MRPGLGGELKDLHVHFSEYNSKFFFMGLAFPPWPVESFCVSQGSIISSSYRVREIYKSR